MHDYVDFAEEIAALEADVGYWENKAENFEFLLKNVVQVLGETVTHVQVDSLAKKVEEVLAEINENLNCSRG